MYPEVIVRQSGGGSSLPRPESGVGQEEGASPSRPTPRIGQEGVMYPHARIR